MQELNIMYMIFDVIFVISTARCHVIFDTLRLSSATERVECKCRWNAKLIITNFIMTHRDNKKSARPFKHRQTHDGKLKVWCSEHVFYFNLPHFKVFWEAHSIRLESFGRKWHRAFSSTRGLFYQNNKSSLMMWRGSVGSWEFGGKSKVHRRASCFM